MAEMGERVANLEARLDAQSQDLAQIRQSVDRLAASNEGRFTDVNARFLSLEQRMADGFRDVREELRDLGKEMHSQFRWLLGGMAGTAITVILAMFAKELLSR